MKENEFHRRFHHVRQVNNEHDYPLRVKGKQAAVLCPIVLRDQLTVLFTQRAEHLRHHGGQVSFPGGRKEDTDVSLVETAFRETEEEIGLSRKGIEVVGNLQPYRTVSSYEVTPYIGLVSLPFALQLDENEVSRVFEVPLSYLVDQSNHYIHWIERNGRRFPIYFIPWEDTFIWGATAAFVRTLSNHLAN